MSKPAFSPTFSLDDFWQSEAQDHQNVAAATFGTLQNDFARMLDICASALGAGGKIMFFGNGGSAADAQHIATELSVRYVKDRKALAAIALTTDTSTLTAAGNDYGFDHIFSRQIEAIGQSGDVAIGFSTSGNSGNVLKALKHAHDNGIHTVGFSGRDGGKMHDLCDVLLVVPSDTTARIQEMHITLGHMLCGALEQKLGLA